MAAPNLARWSNELDNPVWAPNYLTVTKLSVGDYTQAADWVDANNNALNQFRAVITRPASLNGVASLAELNIPEYVPNNLYTATLWFNANNGVDSWTSEMTFFMSDSAGSTVTSSMTPPGQNTPTTPSLTTSGGSAAWSGASSSMVKLSGNWDQWTISATTSATPNLKLNLGIGSAAGSPIGSSLILGGLALYNSSATNFVATTGQTVGSAILPVFDFPFHTVATRYPQNATSFQFGGGYVFTASPTSPPQRQFTLSFEALQWFVDGNGNIDTVTNPQINLGALDAFYRQVQTNQAFYYDHPAYGTLQVRFLKPLVIPPTHAGGTGAVLKVTLDFVEVL